MVDVARPVAVVDGRRSHSSVQVPGVPSLVLRSGASRRAHLRDHEGDHDDEQRDDHDQGGKQSDSSGSTGEEPAIRAVVQDASAVARPRRCQSPLDMCTDSPRFGLGSPGKRGRFLRDRYGGPVIGGPHPRCSVSSAHGSGRRRGARVPDRARARGPRRLRARTLRDAGHEHVDHPGPRPLRVGWAPARHPARRDRRAAVPRPPAQGVLLGDGVRPPRRGCRGRHPRESGGLPAHHLVDRIPKPPSAT